MEIRLLSNFRYCRHFVGELIMKPRWLFPPSKVHLNEKRLHYATTVKNIVICCVGINWYRSPLVMADEESTRKKISPFCKSVVEKVSTIFEMSPVINLIISYSLSPCLPSHHPSPLPRRMNKQAGKWDVTFLFNVGSIQNTFQILFQKPYSI